MTGANHLSNGGNNLLSLLQISNSAFPTGAFTHSYGFETWIDGRVVDDAAEAMKRCRQWLRFGIATGDGVAVAIAFRKMLYDDMRGLAALNELVDALKLSRETREASKQTGAALLSACHDIFELPETDRLYSLSDDESVRLHHAVVYGVVAAGLGSTEGEAVETFLWGGLSNLASVIGRLVPLGQVDVQRIIATSAPLIEECAEIARSRDETDMCSLFASLDAASMRHERLPTRLCIS